MSYTKHNKFIPLKFSIEERKIYFFIASCFLFYSTSSFGQYDRDSSRGSSGFEIKTVYGFLIAHRGALAILQERHAYGIEISYLKPADGTKSFHEKLLFPDVGFTLAWFDLGNRDRLGSGIALYPFINLPLHAKDDWRLHLRYGAGAGYIEKTFDADNNPKNAAIGTHLNGVMHLDLHIEKELSEQTLLELGAGITHFSNGSIGIPNLGINMAMANLGIIHYFGERKSIQRNLPDESIKNNLQVFAAGGIKKIYPPGGQTYEVGTISLSYNRPLKKSAFWGIGAEMFYDRSLEERIQRANPENTGSKGAIRPGIYASLELRLNHVGISVNTGVYPYSKWKGDGSFYNRIGTRYYINKLFLLVNLKTHKAKADFFEWGIGYTFSKLKKAHSQSLH